VKKKTLLFESKYLQENFKLLFKHNNIEIYDVEHAIGRLHERFPELKNIIFYKLISKGLDKLNIDNLKSYAENYVFINKKYDLKVPIEIRPDRHNKNKLIAVITTVLKNSEHEHNLKNEIEIIVEQNKIGFYKKVRYFKENSYIDRWFNLYFEDGQSYKDFKEVKI